MAGNRERRESTVKFAAESSTNRKNGDSESSRYPSPHRSNLISNGGSPGESPTGGRALGRAKTSYWSSKWTRKDAISKGAQEECSRGAFLTPADARQCLMKFYEVEYSHCSRNTPSNWDAEQSKYYLNGFSFGDNEELETQRRACPLTLGPAELMEIWVDKVLSEFGSSSRHVLKCLVTIGVPPELRGEFWKRAIGNESHLTPDLYRILSNRVSALRKYLSDTSPLINNTSPNSVENNNNNDIHITQNHSDQNSDNKNENSSSSIQPLSMTPLPPQIMSQNSPDKPSDHAEEKVGDSPSCTPTTATEDNTLLSRGSRDEQLAQIIRASGVPELIDRIVLRVDDKSSDQTSKVVTPSSDTHSTPDSSNKLRIKQLDLSSMNRLPCKQTWLMATETSRAFPDDRAIPLRSCATNSKAISNYQPSETHRGNAISFLVKDIEKQLTHRKKQDQHSVLLSPETAGGESLTNEGSDSSKTRNGSVTGSSIVKSSMTELGTETEFKNSENNKFFDESSTSSSSYSSSSEDGSEIYHQRSTPTHLLETGVSVSSDKSNIDLLPVEDGEKRIIINELPSKKVLTKNNSDDESSYANSSAIEEMETTASSSLTKSTDSPQSQSVSNNFNDNLIPERTIDNDKSSQEINTNGSPSFEREPNTEIASKPTIENSLFLVPEVLKAFETIAMDIHRTIPRQIALENSLKPNHKGLVPSSRHKMFYQTDLHGPLRSVLETFSMLRPDIGYVQGMAYIAAMLLLTMDEFSAFACFANLLVHRDSLFAFFQFDMKTISIYFRAFDLLFAESFPIIFSKLHRGRLSSDIFLVEWWFTLFTRALPFDVAVQVWDHFLLEGDIVLFQVGLGMLSYFREDLENGSMDHCLSLLSTSTNDHLDNMDSERFFNEVAQTKLTRTKLAMSLRAAEIDSIDTNRNEIIEEFSPRPSPVQKEIPKDKGGKSKQNVASAKSKVVDWKPDANPRDEVPKIPLESITPVKQPNDESDCPLVEGEGSSGRPSLQHDATTNLQPPAQYSGQLSQEMESKPKSSPRVWGKKKLWSLMHLVKDTSPNGRKDKQTERDDQTEGKSLGEETGDN